MSTHRQELRLRLEPAVIQELETRATAAGMAKTDGKTGGASAYVRRIVLQHLGLPDAADPHQQQSKARRRQVMLDHFNYRVETFADGGFAIVPSGSPALKELRAAGFHVDEYLQRNAGLPGRRTYIMVPVADWDALAARQRKDAPRPFRMPTEADLMQDPIESERRMN